MSAPGSPRSRIARRSALALTTCLLVGASLGSAVASEAQSPLPSAAPASPLVAASPAVSPGAGFFPLPEIVAEIPADIPTVSLEPTSEPSLEVGETTAFTLQHCGLLSPVDVDGNLWRPVGGVDPSGGPIDTDDEISELINATPGELTLIDEDVAHFTTQKGQVILLERAEGALDYPLCM